MKRIAKSAIAILFIFALFVVGHDMTFSTGAMASSENQVTPDHSFSFDSVTYGSPNDGIDFNELVGFGNGIYLGLYNHVSDIAQHNRDGRGSSYEQYATGYESASRPILWQTRGESNGSLTLISEYVLDCRPFDTDHNDGSTDYSQSDIRKWLNGDFLDSFSSVENSILVPTEISHYYTTTKKSSVDKVFLPGGSYIYDEINDTFIRSEDGDYPILYNGATFMIRLDDRDIVSLRNGRVLIDDKTGYNPRWIVAHTRETVPRDFDLPLTHINISAFGMLGNVFADSNFGVRMVMNIDPEAILFASAITTNPKPGEMAADSANYIQAKPLYGYTYVTESGFDTGLDQREAFFERYPGEQENRTRHYELISETENALRDDYHKGNMTTYEIFAALDEYHASADYKALESALDLGLPITNYKLTIVNPDISLSAVTYGGISLANGSGIPEEIGGSFILSGTGRGHDKLAYKIVQATAGSRTIVGYGTGDAISLTIDTKGLTPGGDYTLYVWAQKDNAVNSHEGSAPMYFKLGSNVPIIGVPVTVTPTASSISVNGETIAFEAYNIGGNNYFKLRDLAYALDNTEKQFEVSYDNTTRAIKLTSGLPYTHVGGEMVQGDERAKTAAPSLSTIYFDGELRNLVAYNIGGNNFFKLRDLMEVLDIFVGYDSVTKAIMLDTSRGYLS